MNDIYINKRKLKFIFFSIIYQILIPQGVYQGTMEENTIYNPDVFKSLMDFLEFLQSNWGFQQFIQVYVTLPMIFLLIILRKSVKSQDNSLSINVQVNSYKENLTGLQKSLNNLSNIYSNSLQQLYTLYANIIQEMVNRDRNRGDIDKQIYRVVETLNNIQEHIRLLGKSIQNETISDQELSYIYNELRYKVGLMSKDMDIIMDILKEEYDILKDEEFEKQLRGIKILKIQIEDTGLTSYDPDQLIQKLKDNESKKRRDDIINDINKLYDSLKIILIEFNKIEQMMVKNYENIEIKDYNLSDDKKKGLFEFNKKRVDR